MPLMYCISARISPPRAPFHKRLNYSFNSFYREKREMVNITKKTIRKKSLELIEDDLINEALYIAKVSNIVNDHDKAYFYICIYEFISVMRKTRNNIDDFIPIYSINVLTYIFIKTLLINNIIHNIHL